MRRRRLLAAGLPLAAALTLAPGAGALDPDAIVIALAPNTPSTGTRLDATVDGTKFDPSYAKTPSQVRIDGPLGLQVDPTAVTQMCTPAQASSHDCPPASKVANGVVTVVVSFLENRQTISGQLGGYLAPPEQPGDIASLVVDATAHGQRLTTTGRVVPAANGHGPTLLFDDVSGGKALPPGVSIRLQYLQISAGAGRTVVGHETRRHHVKVTKRVHGRKRRVTVTKKVRVTTRVRRELLTTPPTCPGTWQATGTITYTDASTVALAATTPCQT